jgi:monovalent cation:H+ antiporter-2, CPA2 family
MPIGGSRDPLQSLPGIRESHQALTKVEPRAAKVDQDSRMNAIETIIVLLLLVLGVPEVCRRIGRPALANALYVGMGIGMASLLGSDVKTMLLQAGKVGFLLLLFEVGLEIELPNWRRMLAPVRFALFWILAQTPLLLAFTHLSGLSLAEAAVATVALTSCALGMSYAAWKDFPTQNTEAHASLLLVMITLEVLAIVGLSVGASLLQTGFTWTLAPKAVGTLAVLGVVGLLAPRVEWMVRLILDRSRQWRIHLLILLVLIICALSERLGVSAPKAAFFLGLFMSRIEHEGHPLEHYVAPLSQRFLIPGFFLSLGLQIPSNLLAQPIALLALGTAGTLLGFRHVLHSRWLRSGVGDRAWMLLTPNLTMVALAATTFLDLKRPTESAAWLLLTGLFLSVGALIGLPPVVSTPPQLRE